MASEFKLPELGENIESGTVISVKVSAGDTVSIDQVIMELETDKAVIEVPSEVEGTIEKVSVKEGEEVKVGQVVLTVKEGSSAAPKKKEQTSETQPESKEEKPSEEKQSASKGEKSEPASKSAKKKSAGIVDFKIPELGENIESGTVAKLLVSVGDTVQKEQGLLELETDKAVAEVPSEIDGTIKEILIEEGDQVKVGQVAFKIASEVEEATQTESEPEEPERPSEPETEKVTKTKEETAQSEPKPLTAEYEKPRSPKDLAPAAPSVRRFAREIGININEVPGTGPGGRISVEDVKRYSKAINTQRKASSTVFKGFEAEALPDFSKWGKVAVQPMSKVRESTAKHLSYAWATIPHVTQFDKADITELEKLRKQYSQKAELAGGKLTVTAILIKVIEKALKKFPQFNASVDMSKMEIIYKQYFNIGVAVDTDRGLLVPVLKNVDQKNIIDLSVELTEMSKKARDRKLSLDEMQGGNFSISNLGGIGGTGFTPVVHSPDVAILGVSRSNVEPVYLDGEFQPRLMMPLSLSYDHRLIDGADAARFLRWVCEALEQPFLLSLEG
jgi:pyruvate dehydrogenase E2 component (dihydrolipoamide acetyltransferase)